MFFDFSLLLCESSWAFKVVKNIIENAKKQSKKFWSGSPKNSGIGPLKFSSEVPLQKILTMFYIDFWFSYVFFGACSSPKNIAKPAVFCPKCYKKSEESAQKNAWFGRFHHPVQRSSDPCTPEAASAKASEILVGPPRSPILGATPV